MNKINKNNKFLEFDFKKTKKLYKNNNHRLSFKISAKVEWV